MSDTPKSFRELAREWRGITGVAIFYAQLERLCDEWERFLKEKDTNCSRIVLNQYRLLGAKER